VPGKAAYQLLAAANPEEAKRIRRVYGQGPTFLVTLNRTEGFFGTRCSAGGTCSRRQGAACCQDSPPLLAGLGASSPSEALSHLAKQPQHFLLQGPLDTVPKPRSCPGQAAWQRISPSSCLSPFLGLPAPPPPREDPTAPQAQPGRCTKASLSYTDCSVPVSAKDQRWQLANSRRLEANEPGHRAPIQRTPSAPRSSRVCASELAWPGGPSTSHLFLKPFCTAAPRCRVRGFHPSAATMTQGQAGNSFCWGSAGSPSSGQRRERSPPDPCSMRGGGSLCSKKPTLAARAPAGSSPGPVSAMRPCWVTLPSAPNRFQRLTLPGGQTCDRSAAATEMAGSAAWARPAGLS